MKSYGAFRTPKLFEYLFPGAMWGDSDINNAPLYLTFDDGPDPINTPAVVEVLKHYNIPAAFFLKGKKIPGNESLISSMVENGFQVGYHGRTHATWWLRSKSFKMNEMNPEELFPGATGQFTKDPFFLRAPFGRIDPTVFRIAQYLNGVIVQFRLVIGDWLPGKSRDILLNDLETRVQSGDIVALHDGGRNGHLLPEILDTFIPRWIESGKTFNSLKNLYTSRLCT